MVSFVYFIQAGGRGPIKIGLSDNPRDRLSSLQVAHYVRLTLRAIYPGTHDDERAAHQEASAEHILGEWHRPVGAVPRLIVDARRRMRDLLNGTDASFYIKASLDAAGDVEQASKLFGMKERKLMDRIIMLGGLPRSGWRRRSYRRTAGT